MRKHSISTSNTPSSQNNTNNINSVLNQGSRAVKRSSALFSHSSGNCYGVRRLRFRAPQPTTQSRRLCSLHSSAYAPFTSLCRYRSLFRSLLPSRGFSAASGQLPPPQWCATRQLLICGGYAAVLRRPRRSSAVARHAFHHTSLCTRSPLSAAPAPRPHPQGHRGSSLLRRPAFLPPRLWSFRRCSQQHISIAQQLLLSRRLSGRLPTAHQCSNIPIVLIESLLQLE